MITSRFPHWRFLLGISLGICIVCLLGWLFLPRGPEYLDAPPNEFYQFIAEIPTPTGATELAKSISRDIAPQETCTYFDYVRLYGANTEFSSIKQMYIENLQTKNQESVIARDDIDSVNIVLSDAATVGMYDVTDNLPLAKLTFDEKIWEESKTVFPTVFMFAIAHHYGNCKPHPEWKE